MVSKVSFLAVATSWVTPSYPPSPHSVSPIFLLPGQSPGHHIMARTWCFIVRIYISEKVFFVVLQVYTMIFFAPNPSRFWRIFLNLGIQWEITLYCSENAQTNSGESSRLFSWPLVFCICPTCCKQCPCMFTVVNLNIFFRKEPTCALIPSLLSFVPKLTGDL